MKPQLSLTTLVFGLLVLTSLASVIPVFFVNYTLFSSLDEASRSGVPVSDVIGLFNGTAATGLFSTIIILTVISLVAALILIRLVIIPIKKIEQGFQALEQGDLDVSIKPQGLSEFRHIALGFNAAAKTVRQQTQELAAAKARLQVDFDQAKKINDLTFDRELAMVEMKKELEELRAKQK